MHLKTSTDDQDNMHYGCVSSKSHNIWMEHLHGFHLYCYCHMQEQWFGHSRSGLKCHLYSCIKEKSNSDCHNMPLLGHPVTTVLSSKPQPVLNNFLNLSFLLRMDQAHSTNNDARIIAN